MFNLMKSDSFKSKTVWDTGIRKVYLDSFEFCDNSGQD